MKWLNFQLLLLVFSNVEAQNYEPVIHNQEQFFKFVSDDFHPYSNSSKIKIAKFDSLVISGSDTVFFSNYCWRDSMYSNFQSYCILENGPDWLGWHVKKEANGRFIFFNIYNDSIIFETQALVGATWKLYDLPFGNTIRAEVDSIAYKSTAGINDSVKFISVHAFDINGQPISHPYNDQSFELSKSNGFFKTHVFWNFPLDTVALQRISNIPHHSIGDIYNYNINDEFEYSHFSQSISGPGTYHWVNKHKILNKFYSLLMDTVYYERQTDGFTTQLVSFPPPNYVTTYHNSVDTFFITHLNQLFFIGNPEGNLYDSTMTLSSYYMDNDTTRNITFYGTGGGDLMFNINAIDTCYEINNFEPVRWDEVMATGIGLYSYVFNFIYLNGTYGSTNLVWYNKNGQTWGNYINVSGIPELSINKGIRIIPNPASNEMGFINLDFNPDAILVFDMTGRMIKSYEPEEIFPTADITGLNSGIYFVVIKKSNQSLSLKLIKN